MRKNTWSQKLKRTLTAVLPIEDNRRGECNRCGACCSLPNRCPFLDFDDQNLAICKIYHFRPLNCRKYPRSADEQICPDCGYYFVTDKDEVLVK